MKGIKESVRSPSASFLTGKILSLSLSLPVFLFFHLLTLLQSTRSDFNFNFTPFTLLSPFLPNPNQNQDQRASVSHIGNAQTHQHTYKYNIWAYGPGILGYSDIRTMYHCSPGLSLSLSDVVWGEIYDISEREGEEVGVHRIT